MTQRFVKCLVLSLLFACLVFGLAQQDVARLIVKPFESLPVGSPIDVEVALLGNSDRPLTNNVIEVYLNGEYLRRSRTDEDGTAKIRVSRDLALGNYEITVRFIGTRTYAPAEVVLPVVIRPIYLSIQTVPALAGIPFQLGERQLLSNSEGVARFELTTPGTYTLATLLEPELLVTPDTKVSFSRWSDDTFTPQRVIEIGGEDVTMQIGFTLSHPIQTHFVDLTNEAIEWSRVSSLTLKSSNAAFRTLKSQEPYWLQANRILRQRTGLFPTEILWSVESVMLDGSNVVNRYQQRFAVKPNDNWKIQLLVYQARIRSKDALFGVSVGTGITLTYPDGSTEKHSFDEEGELAIFDMARGHYTMQVKGVGGVAPVTPVMLTKDQDVELKVFSSLDIGAMVALGLCLSLGLLFYGRPHLIKLRKRPVMMLTAQPVLALPEAIPQHKWVLEHGTATEAVKVLEASTVSRLQTESVPFVRHRQQPMIRSHQAPQGERAEDAFIQPVTPQKVEEFYAVELLETVLTAHLKAITPPIARSLGLKAEKVFARLARPPGLITKPMKFEKALSLSKLLKDYGIRTRVTRFEDFLEDELDDTFQSDNELQQFLQETLALPEES